MTRKEMINELLDRVDGELDELSNTQLAELLECDAPLLNSINFELDEEELDSDDDNEEELTLIDDELEELD